MIHIKIAETGSLLCWRCFDQVGYIRFCGGFYLTISELNSVDGHDVSAMDVTQVRNMLRGRAGTTILLGLYSEVRIPPAVAASPLFLLDSACLSRCRGSLSAGRCAIVLRTHRIRALPNALIQRLLCGVAYCPLHLFALNSLITTYSVRVAPVSQRRSSIHFYNLLSLSLHSGSLAFNRLCWLQLPAASVGYPRRRLLLHQLSRWSEAYAFAST